MENEHRNKRKDKDVKSRNRVTRCGECQKLQESIKILKEAEKRRGQELRVQHEGHERELKRLKRQSQKDVEPLLKELKAKDRMIFQLSQKNCQKKTRKNEMRKSERPLPEIEPRSCPASPPQSPVLEEECDSGVSLSPQPDPELSLARSQVRSLERALLLTRECKTSTQNSNEYSQTNTALAEQVRRLERREAALLQELSDLRDQNELQEFRILELEGNNEKWSLRSQSSLDLRTSGFVSNLVECKGDVVREHIAEMVRKAENVDDKLCLQQVLSLLDNLETLSHEHNNCLDDNSDEFHSGRFKMDSMKPSTTRVVATVLPFTSYTSQPMQHEEDFIIKSTTKKKQLSNASSLQESGIFEVDPTELIHVSTQTESRLEGEGKLVELSAEIQKLNQIRETLEEGKKVQKKLSAPDSKEIDFYRARNEFLERKVNIYESSGDDQIKKLVDRLNNEFSLLTQVKELSAEMEKLEHWNQKLDEERCELEEAENDTRLRCQQLEMELESMAERLNDLEESRTCTKKRVRDAKALASYWESMITKYEERNYELEELEMELKHRLEYLELLFPVLIKWHVWIILKLYIFPTKQSLLCIEYKSETHPETNETVNICESNNVNINDYEQIIKSLENEKLAIQKEKNDIVNTLQEERDAAKLEKQEIEYSLRKLSEKYKILIEEYKENKKQKCQRCYERRSPSRDHDYIKKVQELSESNRELRKQIEQLEQREMAYIETLQQADNIWAEMEAAYKKRIADAESNETQLKLRIRQLEESEIKSNKSCASLTERVAELEEIERRLENRKNALERERKVIQKENAHLADELSVLRSDHAVFCDRLEGVITTDTEKLKKRIKQLQEEIEISHKVLEETEEAHIKETSVLRMQLSKANKELLQLDTGNSDMREEISSLETRVAELQTALLEQRIESDRVIKNLSSELAQRDRESFFRRRSLDRPDLTLSLRDELQTTA